MKEKTKNIISWILAILLAFAFTMSGLTKIAGIEMQIKNLESWGYPLWMRFPIGLGELMLAAGLLIPKYRKLTVYGLFGWVAVAVYTHIQASPPQYQMIGAPLMFGLIAILLLAVIVLKPKELVK
jgi:uncharacterized membrane protein YphA (DoxX/SURF4 family)